MLKVGEKAVALIIAEEDVSEKWYMTHASHPVWPGGSSGATIGIGYDLGQQSAETIEADWKDRVSAEDLAVLVSVAGVKGDAASSRIAGIRHVTIPWDDAITVFQSSTLPRYANETEDILTNCEKLPPDAFGVLVSISYNRGWGGWDMDDNRHAEMLQIADEMDAENFSAIPDLIRDMKRLWPVGNGLRGRRDREAALFEEALGSVS